VVRYWAALVGVLFMSACAGSASHKVVASNPAMDKSLACPELDAEIMRAQAIITGVNEDKADVSGADVMDGILWFPFNLIAKDSNYENALSAANHRILAMKQLKTDRRCQDEPSIGGVVSVRDLPKQIRELNQLYKDGILTEAEYMRQKEKLLNAM
jgi:hypothetical protein